LVKLAESNQSIKGIMSENGGDGGGHNNGGSVDQNSSTGMEVVESLLGAPELLKQKRRSEDLESLTREELVARVISLEKHVQQLRNVIAKEQRSQLITHHCLSLNVKPGV
jgi:hypothetical protein